MNPRPRVLLIAELANPDWVSVPLEGWSHSRALAKLADVHVVTHVRNAENFRSRGLTDADFTALDDGLETATTRMADFFRGQKGTQGGGQTLRTAFGSIAYLEFERQIWKTFGKRIEAREFDLVHRLTPLSPTMPSVIAAKCAKARVPFVIGPLNGGLPWPKGHAKTLLKEREWLSYVRSAYKLMPFYRQTREHAAAIIAGSRFTRSEIPARWQAKTVYVPENAIDPERFGEAPVASPPAPPLRVAFVGRLVPYKSPDVVIEAAAPLIREGKVKLDIVGDGPEMTNLRALAAGLEGVTFAGWVKHQELRARLSQAHVFAFPSVREFGGAVVLEAMATGLVPIVMDYGGPGEMVTPRTGFALPMGSREEMTRGVREVLAQLVAEPARLEALRAAGRKRVFDGFTWDAKAAQVFEVYRWVLGQREKPDFGMPLP